MVTAIKAYTLSECMEVMAEYVEAYESRGGQNVVFCEDRLTLIAERAIVSRLGGTFQTRVSTFSRFLPPRVQTISKQGSVMAVGDVMTRLQREKALECFTSISGVGNNAKSIYETLAQFSASDVTPELLEESLVLLPDDTLKKKTSDLAKIYKNYLQYLQDHAFLDESRYLSLLPNIIREDENIKNSTVFFLCYSSFTAQAAHTIRAALESAKNVVGIFCGGDEDIYANRGFDTFVRVCKEYGKVNVLDKGSPLEGEAEVLRKTLFDPEKIGKNRVATKNIHIFETENKMDEAEYVAVQIRKAMQETSTLRYRDFAVLTANVSAYSLPLKRALGEYGVPYFIDEKKSLLSHPLSRFLLDCFRVVRERFSTDSVQSLAQNIFFGESDEYRNYLLKFANYRGGAKRDIKTGDAVNALFPNREVLIESRNRLLLATKNIKSKGYGKEYVRAVWQILDDFNVKQALEDLENKVDDVAQKGYLSQIYDELSLLLDEATLLTGEREMTVSEFSAVLQDGLEATEISLIPLKLDAVFIGDITDSRIEKVGVLFAVGMTDEVPRTGIDSAIVSDKEIARLAEVKTMLEPTVAEVNLRARESACLNLCTFFQQLHISYSLGGDGNGASVSEILRYADAGFCDENGNDLPRKKRYDADDFKYRASAPVPAIRQLLLKKQRYENGMENSSVEYSTLYTALDKLGVSDKDDYLAISEGQVCVEQGERLFFHDGKISPTTLEKYFDCPFKNFVQSGLKVKEREETAVLALDTGNFVHKLLEETVPCVVSYDTEEAFSAFAETKGKEILESPLYATQNDTKSGEFFSQRLLGEGVDVARAIYRQIKNSDFAVEEIEKKIESDKFRGKVDRVDGTDKYVRIIDYKTGTIDDKAVSYYTGRKLQMQLYMSELMGDRIPAGVFYFPAQVQYAEAEDGRFRMKGFLCGAEEALRAGDKNITADKESEYFPASLKKSSGKRIMDEQDFRDFIEYAALVGEQGRAELKDGYIAPSPYTGSCEYCKYGGMCGFNKETHITRNEKTIDTKEIAEIVKRTRNKEEMNNE